ncbi:MAG: hypothetical protein ACRCUP_06910 [Mycoplasmatales bacterium]
MNREELIKIVTELVMKNMSQTQTKSNSTFMVDDLECAAILNNYQLNENVAKILTQVKTTFSLKLTGTSKLTPHYGVELKNQGYVLAENQIANATIVNSHGSTSALTISKKVIDEKSIMYLEVGGTIHIQKNAIITSLAKEQIHNRNICVIRSL